MVGFVLRICPDTIYTNIRCTERKKTVLDDWSLQNESLESRLQDMVSKVFMLRLAGQLPGPNYFDSMTIELRVKLSA